MKLTASKLYNYIQCNHRVWRDVYGPQEEKDQEVNSFVQLLWDKGVLHEEKAIQRIGEYLNLSEGSFEERFDKTINAMKNGVTLIYQGVIQYGDLMGIPDLLRKKEDGTYIPIDIKSGRGLEGVDEEEDESGKPKKHYAVQLCLYQEVLQRLGYSKKHEGIIYDIDNNEIRYDLSSSMGVRNKNLWTEYYADIKQEVIELLENKKQNKPALGGKCKLCPWYQSCKKWAKDNHDLSTLFYVGRKDRDILNKELNINRVEDIKDVDIEKLMSQKKINKEFLKGIGESTLKKIKKRALIMSETKKPVIYERIEFPKAEYELFFDIEDDPTQSFVYLHGVHERRNGVEKFIPFLAEELNDESEKIAWKNFIDYLKSLPQDNYSIYYYSHHEKTTYKKLQNKYSDVITEEELLRIFDNPNSIDLYSVIYKNTDWPLGSYSLKEIATYLGFKWRDETPSGALSIQWYNEYLKEKDKKIMERILKYNEDDCKATMIIKDYLNSRT